mgnify:CR=1 FL=1
MRTIRRKPRASRAALGSGSLPCLPLATSSTAPTQGETKGGKDKLTQGQAMKLRTRVWATDCPLAYLKRRGHDIRSCLSDESVSDMKMETVTGEFKFCLSSKGATSGYFKHDGGFKFNFEERTDLGEVNVLTDKHLKRAGVGSGLGIYCNMHSNSANKNLSAEITLCLVRSALAPPGCTAEEHKAVPINDCAEVDAPRGVEAVQVFESDPIGAFGG